MNTCSRRGCPGSSMSSRLRRTAIPGWPRCWPGSRTTAPCLISSFLSAAELQRLVENDLAVLLSERFEATQPQQQEDEAGRVVAHTGHGAGGPRARNQPPWSTWWSGEGVRLVALTGPGGVGKSRLAVQAAARLEPGIPRMAHGSSTWARCRTPTGPGGDRTGLGLSTSGGRLSTRLRSYLRSRQILLVLDNFEQVPGAAPLVAGLLSAAPGLVVLVTSRTVLRLRGEQEFPVTPLSIPPDGPVRNPGRLERYASVRLFLERARAAVPDFELTSGNAWAIGADLPPAGRPAAGYRAGRGPGQAAAPAGFAGPARRSDGRADRWRPRPARAAADPEEHPGLELQPAVRGRAGAVPPAGGVRGQFRPARCGGGVRRGRWARRWTRWARWWTAASSGWRPGSGTTSRGSGCWRPSASTPWNACATAATGRTLTTGMPPTSWPSPSQPRPSWATRGSSPGWSVWRPATTTSARHCPGWWIPARWARPCS